MQIEKFIKPIIWFLIVGGSISFSFIASNTDNPVRLANSNAQEINSLFPQGWAFFTRDPREEIIRLYEQEEKDYIYLNKSSSLLVADIFGIKRHKRRLSSELAEIIKKIPSKSWMSYENEKLFESMSLLKVTDTLKNEFKNNILKGEKIIYRSKRVPWAWSSSNVKMPYMLAKVYIQ